MRYVQTIAAGIIVGAAIWTSYPERVGADCFEPECIHTKVHRDGTYSSLSYKTELPIAWTLTSENVAGEGWVKEVVPQFNMNIKNGGALGDCEDCDQAQGCLGYNWEQGAAVGTTPSTYCGT